MDDIAEKLKVLLSDPESLGVIANIAQNFAATGENKTGGEERERESQRPKQADFLRSTGMDKLLSALCENSAERRALLLAVRPFLQERKQEKLDQILSLLQGIELFQAAQKLL